MGGYLWFVLAHSPVFLLWVVVWVTLPWKCWCTSGSGRARLASRAIARTRAVGAPNTIATTAGLAYPDAHRMAVVEPPVVAITRLAPIMRAVSSTAFALIGGRPGCGTGGASPMAGTGLSSRKAVAMRRSASVLAASSLIELTGSGMVGLLVDFAGAVAHGAADGRSGMQAGGERVGAASFAGGARVDGLGLGVGGGLGAAGPHAPGTVGILLESARALASGGADGRSGMQAGVERVGAASFAGGARVDRLGLVAGAGLVAAGLHGPGGLERRGFGGGDGPAGGLLHGPGDGADGAPLLLPHSGLDQAPPVHAGDRLHVLRRDLRVQLPREDRAPDGDLEQVGVLGAAAAGRRGLDRLQVGRLDEGVFPAVAVAAVPPGRGSGEAVAVEGERHGGAVGAAVGDAVERRAKDLQGGGHSWRFHSFQVVMRVVMGRDCAGQSRDEGRDGS